MWEDYQFAEVGLITRTGTFTRWKRIKKEKVHDWVYTNPGGLSYFSTIQSFCNSTKTKGELHWSPLFFDLDAEDADDEEQLIENLKVALSDARKLVDFFLTGFEIEPQVWFSGRKGFHVIVPGELCGATPGRKLTYYWKHIAAAIAKKLELETLDWRVYSIPRMWRISNTQHKSGRYKIPLELNSLQEGIPAILARASDRQLNGATDEGDKPLPLQVVEPLATLYNDAVTELQERAKVLESTPLEHPVFGEKHPACINWMLENGLALLGSKNQADMVMSNYCKASGMTLESAEQFISSWSKGIPISLTHIADPEARIVQSMRVLRIVYSDAKYRFSCGSMRTCQPDVNCRQCTVEKDSEVITVPLAGFAEAHNHGRRIAVEVDIVGRDASEMIVPAAITGWCPFNPESAQCGRCNMSRYFNEERSRMERTIIFNSSEKMTLQLIDVTRVAVQHRIKSLFGVEPRCKDFKSTITWGNANVIFLATRVSGDFNIEDEVSRSRAIFLGHGIRLNQGYRLTGYVWNHPFTNKAVLLVDEAEPLKTSLASFNITKERREELKVFQPQLNQAPLDKIEEIHHVFNTNFIRVFGREEIIMAVDLVFHSARRLNFQKSIGLKGWLDILIIGDTRQGKSDVTEKLMEYYDLGVMAAGETASRTGLLYTIHTSGGEDSWIAFGLMCRASGYLVVIDEIHGMSPEDFKVFTLARSKGIVDVKRSEYGIARCETRLISIANARPGKAMASYGYPVQAIPDIPAFQALEDVSRFDYCIGVMAGDVDDATINQDVYEIKELENPYTKELSRDLILWIWTRSPEQIIIERETEKCILAIAMEMSRDYVPDIPLVESADMRHKIARVATAIACRVFSTEDLETVVVKPEHARAARKVIESFYKAPGLDYYGWSDERKRVSFTPERLEVLMYDFQTTFTDWAVIVQWLLDVTNFTKTLLKSACGLSAGQSDQIIAFLVTSRFIATDKHKYIKTPSGRSFLRTLLDKHKNPGGTTELPEGDDDF